MRKWERWGVLIKAKGRNRTIYIFVSKLLKLIDFPFLINKW